MSTVRRSKAMPTDGPTAKFLYTIIKQLDLKSIDWNLVASQLEISNGHAARMRYSRFRQQMEGITSTPRSSRPKKTPSKAKVGASKADMEKGSVPVSSQPMVKQEPQMVPHEPKPYLKVDAYCQNFNLADIPHVSSQPQVTAGPSSHPFMTPCPPFSHASGDLSMYTPSAVFSGPVIGFERPPAPQHIWAPVKSELEEDDSMSDVLIKIEQPQDPGFGMGETHMGPKDMPTARNVEERID
ncbi:hypothetical protein BJX96DRAFT_179793 [Aspergillus floccosus]